MNRAILASSFFSITFLSACGGGSGGNGTTDPQPFFGAVNDIAPVAELTLRQARSIQVGARTVLYTSEGGSEGSLRYVTQTYQDKTSDEVLQLITGVSSLNVKDVQRIQSTEFSCDDGSTLKVKIYSDFSSGEVTTTGTHNGLDISCKSDFDSLLPTNVFDQTSVTQLLQGWGAKYSTAAYSNCTHEIEDMDGFSKDCRGADLVNYTVTDAAGGLHKITTKVSFENKK